MCFIVNAGNICWFDWGYQRLIDELEVFQDSKTLSPKAQRLNTDLCATAPGICLLCSFMDWLQLSLTVIWK